MLTKSFAAFPDAFRVHARSHDHVGLHIGREYASELGALDGQDLADRQHCQVGGAAQDVGVDLFA